MEKPVGERVARLEGVLEQLLPTVIRMEEKLDIALAKASQESVDKAHERIDDLTEAIGSKADSRDVREMRDRVLVWTGGFAVIAVLIGWIGPKLIGMVAG